MLKNKNVNIDLDVLDLDLDDEEGFDLIDIDGDDELESVESADEFELNDFEDDDYEDEVEFVPETPKPLPNRRAVTKTVQSKPVTKKATTKEATSKKPEKVLASSETPKVSKTTKASTTKTTKGEVKTMKTVNVKTVSAKENVKPETKKATVSKTVKTTGKVRVRSTNTSKQTYEGLFTQVTDKVDNYKAIMEENSKLKKGERGRIPTSTAISKELFNQLLAAKFSEVEITEGLKATMVKSMIAMGFDREEVTDAVSNHTFGKTEVEKLSKVFFDVMYDVLSAESGMPLFKTEDTTTIIKGEWQEPSIMDTSRLGHSENSAVYTDRYLKIKVSSKAPESKKTQGILEDGEFVAYETDEE